MQSYIIDKILEWLKNMCIKWFKKKQTTPVVPPVVPPVTSLVVPDPPKPTYNLPHPQEGRNDSATIETTDMFKVLTDFYTKYSISTDNQPFWNQVKFKVEYPLIINGNECPAGTDSQTKTMWIEPQWASAGVLAHELAHISYYQLSPDAQAKFAVLHDGFKNTDILVKLLYSMNGYGLTSEVEGHAEIFRYLGLAMPQELKTFYPRLI